MIYWIKIIFLAGFIAGCASPSAPPLVIYKEPYGSSSKKAVNKTTVINNKNKKERVKQGSNVASKPKKQQPKQSLSVEMTMHKWHWPSAGEVIKKFNSSSKGDGVFSGIKIQAKVGSPVYAAAKGEVVYVGSEIRGYGNLLLIKHSEYVLSSYAYNQKILVKEGDRVRAKQLVSLSGQDSEGMSALYFEIRNAGEALDPLLYLPTISQN